MNIIFKKTITLFVVLIFSNYLQAQFYYSDIVSNINTNNVFQLHKNYKIKKVTVKNVLKQNEEEENNLNKFAIEQEYSNNWQNLKTTINLTNGNERVYTLFYNATSVIKKEDDGLNVNSLIRYEYDTKNRLTAIRTSAVDTSVEDGFFEKHLFEYGTDNLPTKMFKIKNTTDTTVVEFIRDEEKNIGEEKWYRKNVLIETYYYYYNSKKQLTDIVRFNAKYEKMLPEFLFEYNEQNQLIKQTQIPFGSSNYTFTKFDYNTQGLKTMESIYTKKGELLNKLEYSYKD